MPRVLTLACYDLSKPASLRQALKITRHFATGGQYSAHECWLTKRERGVLIRGLQPLAEGSDSIALFRPDPRRQTLVGGTGRVPTDPAFFLIG